MKRANENPPRPKPLGVGSQWRPMFALADVGVGAAYGGWWVMCGKPWGGFTCLPPHALAKILLVCDSNGSRLAPKAIHQESLSNIVKHIK